MAGYCDNFSMIDGGDKFVAFPGLKGEDGTTFYPHVSAEGIISWTNDGGKPNPDPVNIKGADGKSAYQAAVEAGFSGTEAEFNEYLSNIGVLTEEVADQKSAIILNDFRYMLSDCLKKMLWTVPEGAGLVSAIENSLGVTDVDIDNPYVFTTFDGEYIDKNNGGILPDNTWCRTNYLPCKNATSIEFNGNGNIFTTARYGAFYTKNMEFLSNIPVTLNGTTTTVNVPVPNDAEVFCISFNITQRGALSSIIPR